MSQCSAQHLSCSISHVQSLAFLVNMLINMLSCGMWTMHGLTYSGIKSGLKRVEKESDGEFLIRCFWPHFLRSSLDSIQFTAHIELPAEEAEKQYFQKFF